ncbi:MAG: hypothetical protein NZ704_04405 [Geminicoccaceae bacterium]|nr:hypothetical protein [Geminicoccaceae bacterium]
MRRLVSGGVLLSLGLFAAHAAVEAWMEARAVFALEEARRRLPEGAQLDWRRLDAEPLRLALHLEGVRLELPPGAPVRRLEAGTLRLAQAGPATPADLGRRARARARDVVVELAEDRGTVRIGAIEGAQLDIEAFTAALSAPDPWQELRSLALGEMAIEDLRFETRDGDFSLARLALASYADQRLEGFVLERLEGRGPADEKGDLASLSIDRLDLGGVDWDALAAAGPDPATLSALLDRTRVAGLRLVDARLSSRDARLGIARFELAQLGEGRLEGFRIEELGFEQPEGRAALALLELARVDWSRVNFERLFRAGELLGDSLVRVAREMGSGSEEESANGAGSENGEGTENGAEARQPETAPDAEEEEVSEDEALARSFAGLEFLAELTRLEIGPIRIERLGAHDAAGSGVGLERLRWDGLRDRRIGAFELAGVAFRGEDKSELRLERFEQSAVLIAPRDFAERLEAAPRTAEALQSLQAELARLPWDSRTWLSGLAYARDGRTVFGIGRIALRLDQQGSRKRADFELAELLLDPEGLSEEDFRATLLAAGIDRLRLGVRLLSTYDEASLETVLDPLEFDAPGLLALRTSLVARLGADPALDPVTASTDSQLVRAEIRLQDKGLIDRQIDRMAKEAGKKRADFVKQLLREIRSEDPLRSLLDAKRAAEVEKFLLKPRVLVIRLLPPKPVTFVGAFMGLLTTPAQAVKTLGLAIEARES